ncbi:MAG: triose-phosphate isomerase [Robiginitomaculum sp.]
MRQLIAANWKMHGDMSWAVKPDQLLALLSAQTRAKTNVLICPPAHLLAPMAAQNIDSAINIGAQNCHHAVSGAYTGELSATMIADCGAGYAIVGHSERRQYAGESDSDVAAKALAAHKAGLIAIICIGESESQRESGQAQTVTTAQLLGSAPETATSMNTVIAYEPIWAIGTGKVPTLEQIGEIHAHIRDQLAKRFGQDSADNMPILYGGSVKPANAADILAIKNVDGALIGGASLEMESLAAIADCARG